MSSRVRVTMTARPADAQPATGTYLSRQQRAHLHLVRPAPFEDTDRQHEGQPLEPAVRARMEQQLGHDFSRVRVHPEGEAVLSPYRVEVCALTIGADIYFREGYYQPDTASGQQLLAAQLVETLPLDSRTDHPAAASTEAQMSAKDEAVVTDEALPDAADAESEFVADLDSPETEAETPDVKWQGDTEAVGRDARTLMDAATSGTPRPLPQRAELENALGDSLSDVEVYSGPEAREALGTLGVQAAARGHQIAFANPAPTLPLVLHEAVHVLQSRNGGTGMASPVPLDSLAEREAVRFAHQADGGRLLPFRPVQAGLAAGAIGFATGVLDPPAPPATATAPPAPAANAALAPTPPAPTAMPSAPLAGSGTAGALTAGRQPAAVTGVGTAPVVGATPAAGLAPVAGAGAAPATGAAETAAQPPVQLEGADIQGVVASFAEITPTQQAQTYAALGGRLQDVAQTEHASIEGSLPTFRANLPGETAPSQPLSPDAFASAPAPVDIPTPTLAAPAPVTAPDPGTAQAARAADAPPSSVPPQQRSDDIHQALRETQEAARVEGSPGPSPSIAQQAGADSSQLQTQADSAATQASTAQQQAAEAIRQGPGPEQVRPQALHAEATVGSVAPLSVAPPAPVPGTQQYLTMNLSPDVRGSFDQRVASERHGQMEQAHTQLQQATATRDSARDAAVAQANQDADTVRTTTVQDRNAAVETQRARIRTERANTVAQQEQAVSDAQGRIDSERTSHQQGIDTRVATDQRQIDDHYQRADADVQHQVDEGQRQADEKRREAERASEDESWFDRAVDWIADALEAFADAITKVFNAIKNAITTIIDAVVSLANSIIDAVVSFINEAIAALGAVLKALVQNLLGEIFPELAARLCRYIDEAVDLAQRAVTAIGNTLKEGIARVASAVKAAVNAVIGAFEAAVQIGVALLTAAVTGDFSAVLRKVLEAALAIAGISPEQFYAFIGRAEETFRIIIDAPGAFVGHLIDAFVGGVQRFASNLLTHLRNAIISWLTGALGGAGLRLPEHFDLMGVLSLVQQILGLTWDRIRQEIVRIIGERAVQIIEFIWSYVQTLMQGGWPALFERIKQDLSNLADMVLGAIKDYLLERVVIAAITRLATLFNPVGALVQLLLAAWNLYTFLRDQLARIRQVLAGIVAAIDNIARGVLGPAQEAVETILAGLLPLAIDLLARLLGLSGVGERVREIIHNVQEAIWRAIRSLIERVRGLFRGGTSARAEGQTGDVGDQAAHALLAQLSEDHTREEVQALAQGVQREYAARGVRRIEVGPRQEDDSFQILVEASPLLPKILMRLARRGYSVRMASTLHFSAPATLQTPRTFYSTGVPDPNQPGQYIQAASAGPTGQLVHPVRGSRTLTTLAPPERITSDVHQLTTYNRGATARSGREPLTNDSHAEVAFINWFKNDISTDSRKNLERLEITISRSPCSFCARDLARFMHSEVLPHVKPNFSASLTYTSVHKGDNPTTVEDLEQLRRARLIPDGPEVEQTAEQAGKDSRYASQPIR
jgi:phage-related protein